MEVSEWLQREDIKRLIEEIKGKKDKLIPFVGSGVSIPSGLPNWEQLLYDLSSKLDTKYQTSIND